MFQLRNELTIGNIQDKADGIGNGTITRLMNQQKNWLEASNPKRGAPGLQIIRCQATSQEAEPLIGDISPKKTIKRAGGDKNKSVLLETYTELLSAVIDKELSTESSALSKKI